MKFEIIVPAYGDCHDLSTTIDSILQQTHKDKNIHVCFDSVTPDLEKKITNNWSKEPSILFYKSGSDRFYALKNIIRVLDGLTDESIIGIVDCGDFLFRRDCLDLVDKEYSDTVKCVWTAHCWDKNGMNQSRPLDDNISPYNQRWSSSHFRTFLLSYYKRVNKKNFLDEDGLFFKRTYDQALMLPIIHLVLNDGFHTKYIDKTCYIYTGNYEPLGEDNQYQLHLEKFIRERGYIE